MGGVSTMAISVFKNKFLKIPGSSEEYKHKIPKISLKAAYVELIEVTSYVPTSDFCSTLNYCFRLPVEDLDYLNAYDCFVYDGEIYVTDYESGYIVAYDLSGIRQRQFRFSSSYSSYPVFKIYDEKLYIEVRSAFDDRIIIYDLNFNGVGSINPQATRYDDFLIYNDEVYVFLGTVFDVYDLDGNYQRRVTYGSGLTHEVVRCVESQGYFYLTDKNKDGFFVYDSLGNYIGHFGAAYLSNAHDSTDPLYKDIVVYGNRIYCSNRPSGNIFVFNLSGTYHVTITLAGLGSRSVSSFHIYNDRIYTASGRMMMINELNGDYVHHWDMTVDYP
jgi:hypothetical protein